MGSSNNPTNEDELLLSRVYNDLDVRATNDGSRICQHLTDLQTVQDISDVDIIILIYLFIKHVLFILMC